jgi:glucose-1-phosphate adenylyltransferase
MYCWPHWRVCAPATGRGFGRHVLPSTVASHRLMAYDFTTNQVPGVAGFEEPAYWRDVSAIDAYFEAHFDTVGTTPRFRVANRQWPIQAAADAVVESAQIENALMNRSVVGSGCLVDGAVLEHSWTARIWCLPAKA